MKRYIHIKKEDRESVTRAFGISEKGMFNAIRFNDRRGDTDLAKKVHKLAMDRGGIAVAEVPETETLFDANGYMRQYLPNNMTLELNKKTGDHEVPHKGEKVRCYENVEVAEIEGVQSRALALR